MAISALRELAKEHAQGNLDKETYRNSRAELVRGIIAGTIPLTQIDYPPLVQPLEPESLDETQRREDKKKSPAQKAEPATGNIESENSTSASIPESSNASNKLLIAGLFVAVIAIVVVAFFALTGDGKAKKTNSPRQTDTEVTASAPKAQAQNLVQDFLNKKNWSNDTLDGFLAEWAQLPADDLLNVNESLEMGQLTNAIYKQLLEEQALSGLVDDDSSLNKQRQLVQFASELGIKDSRIGRLEQSESLQAIPEVITEEPMESAEP